tara:strand:+ start:981 stop:1166 length:186 start_codon:yes stop_codon:yes gene_type:complete
MIQKSTYTELKYIKNPKQENDGIDCKIDGKRWCVPLDLDNVHYAEIKRQVDAGELTIEEAD